ncbi:unnamed protein product [Enterobius vermicularis]|uniref:PH domain-containing protein n=1 Tax=Enterobius vermicularis TaxID=51028 RepID=A0A0N4UZI8_ENTVE|nr:unnamed protein product [Enterobius vermicularis]
MKNVVGAGIETSPKSDLLKYELELVGSDPSDLELLLCANFYLTFELVFPTGLLKHLKWDVRNVEIKVGNRSYAAQILILENCVFFWVGTRCELDSFYFARNDRGLALLETLDTAHAHLDRFTGKISELFPEKQVLFGTDLKVDDSTFWFELLQKLVEEVSNNRSLYQLSAENYSELP